MRKILAAVVLMLSYAAIADDGTSLFDASGKPTAYIAEELTIYLWSGKPVAYLHTDSGKVHVYGFNGKHLGWFVGGVIRDHEGNAACATKDSLRSTEFEPFKSFKEFKPFKAFKEFAPFRPSFSSSWSDAPCKFVLAEGGTP